MRRSFVTPTCVLALALLPAALCAQTATTKTPATQQPTAQQPAAQQPAAPAQPAAPKVTFATPVGMLLVQIKPDQTAAFEEMVGKLKAGLAKTQDATLKQQAAGFKVFKATEPFGTNALYVVIMDPTVPSSEYELFAMLQKVMTPEELRAPEAAEMWKRYAGAFAAGLSKVSLTPVSSAGAM